MDIIRRKPDLSTFLNEATNFGKTVGFQSANVARLVEATVSAGAVGAAQNMIGEAVHGVIPRKKAHRALANLRREFPSAMLFAASWIRGVFALVEEPIQSTKCVLPPAPRALHGDGAADKPKA